MFTYATRAMRNDPYLKAFLGEESLTAGTIFLGWGHKPTADRARRRAAEQHLPYIAVEDGFLRSLDLGCRGARPLSLVVDHTGIYYDATGPSDLENLLNDTGWESDELMASARRAMQDIIRLRLSKYNHAPDAAADLWDGVPAPRALVIDQTAGDASVSLGMADAQSFTRMLDAALERHAPGHVCVKTHPDVIAGKKQGYLNDAASRAGVTLIAADCSPLSLLAGVDEVYTVTSQMGFEALMLGLPVHCFGMPFYAGWGATIDHMACPRRVRRRSVEEIFAAAYLRYARYVNPVTGGRCDIHDIISLLAEQRRQNERNRATHACVGFRWWKKPYARAYLHSTGGSAAFFRRARAAVRSGCSDVVAWSSGVSAELERQCAGAHVPLARMEDGFIRSVGLGCDFNWPYSLVVDRKGIYYDPSRASEIEDILNTMPARPDHAALMTRAAALRALILERQLTKYNTGASNAALDLPTDRTIVLVPGQVEDDASVRRGGFGMKNLDLLRAARTARPEACIIYKPHPDVERGTRAGAIPENVVRESADILLRDYPMGRLLPRVHEVHTLTSQTGFEALLRGVRVVTYGGPFYAGWGLTEDRQVFARRTARLTLDELTAGVLLLYPAYYDWQTGMFCRAEDVCHRLLQPGGQKKGRIWARLANAVRVTARRLGL